MLSIPLEGGRNQKMVMKDVRISQKENWQDRHWKTITSCYNKSPWFSHYSDELHALFTTAHLFLVDWNIACYEWAADKLSIHTPWRLSDSYNKNYGDSVADWRGKLMPATIDRIFAAGQRYPQVFEDRFGFVPNLSVMDYLFCVGPGPVTI